MNYVLEVPDISEEGVSAAETETNLMYFTFY